MQEVSTRSVEWIVKVVFVVGLLMNLASGVFIVIAFYRVGGINWQLTTELANIVPNVISVVVLMDSIRRLKRASKGSLEIETWQMVWHIWSFTAVTFDGIGLSLCTRNASSNPKFFYGTYMTLVILLFCCEMPFLFIVNRITGQAIIKNDALNEVSVLMDETMIDNEIERNLMDGGTQSVRTASEDTHNDSRNSLGFKSQKPNSLPIQV